ncbi:unnamed protein product [Tilletia controversa]|nr:unnamed protein product [Tilletia controversa]
MLALILTTLILAFLSLLSSFAVLLRTLLPIVLASKANRSRHRGAYGANLRTTSVDPRSSSVASLRTRRTSEGRSDSGAGPWHDTSPSGWASGGTSATGPTRLRSAQRVQVWLAIFDIVSIAFLLAYWIVVATSPRPTSITFPASPFTDGRSAALLIIALCLRPTLLTLVSTVAFSHIRLGRSSYLGKLDWGLWAITTVFVASIGGLAGILFRCTPHEIASKFLTGSLLGINVILLVAGTVTIFGLMSTIYQAKTAFRFSMHANQGYQGMERSGRSSLTTPNGELGSPTKANLEQSKSLHGLSPSLHEVATDRGTFGVRKSDDLPEPINDFNEAPHPVPQAGEVNALMGTVTTTTGGAMSAVVGSAIASSADPYRLAPPSTQKDTISTARSLATGPFHGGSLGPSGRSPLSTMPERDTATQATHPKHRLGSSTSVTSETHALLDVEVEDRRPSQLSGQSELSDGSGLPYHRNNNSRKSLKEVLDGIAKANQGYDVNDWRHSLSQIRIAASEFSDDDAATLSQRSPRPSIQPDEGLRSSGLPPSPLSQDQAMSPDRIRREVEEQVDRMFAEVGLNSFIKDKWRQIVPTGSLPLVRSPNQSGPDPAEGSRGWKRASTFAQIQTAAFSTKPLLLVPATPRLDHNLIPHTYDPNFDGTFSQSARSAQMGEHSGPERTPSQFSHTGIRYVRTDVVDRELKGSSDSNPFSLKSSMQHCLPAPSRLGTFGEENISDLHHAVDFSHDLPAQASAAAESRPQHASPLHDIFASPQRQSQDDCDRSTKLRPPFFDPGYLAPTAHQLGFVNVPASRTLPTMRGSSLSLGHDSIPPSEASTELVQAVQGGGDDMLGAQSALVRIASYATLRAAVQRVEFDLSGEEDRLQRAARTGSKEAVGQRAAAVAKQNYTLHMLKQAQWQEELLSRRETRVAFLRLSGHMIGMWIPFIFSLPYLVFGLAHPRATSAPFALALLLSLSIILGADDDERTMVEQYQNFYRRYLSDLPDIFNFNSAREAFRDARQSIVNRLSIRQNLEPTTVAWNMRATNLSTTDATYGTDCAPGDDSVHSFTTAADGGETDEQQTAAGDTLGIRTSPTTTHPQTDGLSAIGSVPSVEPTATSDGSKVFEWVPQQSRASPSRLPTGRSSSISVEAGRSFASLQNVTTRSRQGKHRRDAASLPDAKPELLVEALKDVSVLQPPPSRNDPVGDDLSEPITAEENEEQESQPPATASADNSLSLSVGNARGFEDSNRRSLASELGMVSTRKSLGSETGIESIASGRQRKSLSSDFGLLLAALREQKEDSPSSSKRITSDSMSSTIMSEEISLSSPSRINMTPISNSLRMHSSPPHSRSAAANAVADTTSSISIEEEEEEAAAEALTSLAEEVAGAQMAADQSEQRRPSDEEIIQAIRQMDPLTLHRYMHPAMPLETLDEVTEEMTADLTRSLDAIWMRSKRESFMSMRNQAAIGTPVKSGPQDERSFLGLNTPQSVVGRYGWAVIAKKAEQTICETAAITAVTTALNTRSAETGGQNGITIENRSDVSAFDNSVWNSLAVAPLSFTVPNDGVDSQRVRKASEASISTIGFEREAEWIDCPQGAFPKHSTLKSESKTNSKAGKQRSHTQQSDSTIVNRTSFNSSSSSSNRSSTFSSASGVKAAGVPESPWAVITTRGEADLTILSPAPTTHAPSVVEVAEKAASMVTQRISRFENLSAAQETPCKMGSNRSASIGEYNAACASQARNLPELGLNSASMIMVMAAERHRIALQDKTNRPVGSHDAHDIPDVKRSHPSSTRQSLISASSSSPTKRSSYPPAHQDEVAPETNYSQTASLGRKSVRTGGTIPTIHVRGPSDSSALSFYHY